MNFNISQNDPEGFTVTSPREMFQNTFGGAPKFMIDSEFAYYTRKVYAQVESFLGKFEKTIATSFINKNRNLVDTDVIYTSVDKGIIIAFRQFWDICDYAIGEYGDEVETDDLYDDVVIKKNAKFQARLTLFATCEDPEYETFIKKIISKDKKAKRKDRELNIICFNPHEGIYLKSFKTNKVNIDIENNYNDDFVDVSNEIITRLSKRHDNGIVLLHSVPGCGKTSYLRYICQNIKNKRIIYLPPDLTHRLAEPDFMTFLLQTPDSILLIEDAENSLQKRDAGGNQAVSNLLNNSDGLLGDALKLQVVCTFNCDIKNIDDALLRPGRLIAEYKFEKLKKEKVTKLFKKLYGEESEILSKYTGEDMTLAEIYNMDQKKFLTKKKQETIGFKKSN